MSSQGTPPKDSHALGSSHGAREIVSLLSPYSPAKAEGGSKVAVEDNIALQGTQSTKISYFHQQRVMVNKVTCWGPARVLDALTLKLKDIECLKPGEMMNDELVNYGL